MVIESNIETRTVYWWSVKGCAIMLKPSLVWLPKPHIKPRIVRHRGSSSLPVFCTVCNKKLGGAWEWGWLKPVMFISPKYSYNHISSSVVRYSLEYRLLVCYYHDKIITIISWKHPSEIVADSHFSFSTQQVCCASWAWKGSIASCS